MIVTLTAVERVVAPLLSVATAEREYDPLATLLHVTVCGVDVRVPISVEPAKNSTLLTDPSVSLAFALTFIVAGAV